MFVGDKLTSYSVCLCAADNCALREPGYARWRLIGVQVFVLPGEALYESPDSSMSLPNIDAGVNAADRARPESSPQGVRNRPLLALFLFPPSELFFNRLRCTRKG